MFILAALTGLSGLQKKKGWDDEDDIKLGGKWGAGPADREGLDILEIHHVHTSTPQRINLRILYFKNNKMLRNKP